MQSRETVIFSGYTDLYKNKELTDFEIHTNDNNILYAHKCHLAASSGYFRSMLNSNMIETENNKIHFDNISTKVMTVIIEYIYGVGYVKIDDLDNGMELLQAADMLDIQFIVENVERYLVDFMTDEYLFKIYKTVQTPKIRGKVKSYLHKNPHLLHDGSLGDVLHEFEYDIIMDVVIVMMRAEYSNAKFGYKNCLDVLIKWYDDQPSNEREQLDIKINECVVTEIEKVDPDYKYSMEYLLNLNKKEKVTFNIPLHVFTDEELNDLSKSSLGQVTSVKTLILQAIEYRSKPMQLQVTSKRNEFIDNSASYESLLVFGKLLPDSNQGIKNKDYNAVYVLQEGFCDQNWKTLPISIPPGLKSIQCVNINGFVFISDVISGECHLFDPQTWKWSQLPALQYQGKVIQHFSLVAVGKNSVFAIGGVMNGKLSKFVMKYSFFFKSWSKCCTIPEALKDVGTGVSNDIVYLAGGNRTLDNSWKYPESDKSSWSSMFCSLNVKSGKLQRLPNLPEKVPGAYLHVARCQSTEYIFIVSASPFCRNVEIFDNIRFLTTNFSCALDNWNFPSSYPRGILSVATDDVDLTHFIVHSNESPSSQNGNKKSIKMVLTRTDYFEHQKKLPPLSDDFYCRRAIFVGVLDHLQVQ